MHDFYRSLYEDARHVYAQDLTRLVQDEDMNTDQTTGTTTYSTIVQHDSPNKDNDIKPINTKFETNKNNTNKSHNNDNKNNNSNDNRSSNNNDNKNNDENKSNNNNNHTHTMPSGLSTLPKDPEDDAIVTNRFLNVLSKHHTKSRRPQPYPAHSISLSYEPTTSIHHRAISRRTTTHKKSIKEIQQEVYSTVSNKRKKMSLRQRKLSKFDGQLKSFSYSESQGSFCYCVLTE